MPQQRYLFMWCWGHHLTNIPAKKLNIFLKFVFIKICFIIRNRICHKILFFLFLWLYLSLKMLCSSSVVGSCAEGFEHNIQHTQEKRGYKGPKGLHMNGMSAVLLLIKATTPPAQQPITPWWSPCTRWLLAHRRTSPIAIKAVFFGSSKCVNCEICLEI